MAYDVRTARQSFILRRSSSYVFARAIDNESSLRSIAHQTMTSSAVFGVILTFKQQRHVKSMSTLIAAGRIRCTSCLANRRHSFVVELTFIFIYMSQTVTQGSSQLFTKATLLYVHSINMFIDRCILPHCTSVYCELVHLMLFYFSGLKSSM